MQVRDLMTREVITVSEEDSAIKVGDALERENSSAAVVVKNGEVLGIVSKETFFSKIGLFCERRLEDFKVRDLMEYDVECVHEEDDLSVACLGLLNLKTNVDRLPVLSDGKLSGILSKLEFTDLFAKKMGKKFKVRDLMAFSPVTIDDYAPLNKIVDEMLSSGVKRILVMSGNRMVGIIAVKDISLSLFREKKMCKNFNPVSMLTAEDLMTRNPITVKSAADAASAAKIMVEKGIGGIPVVDKKLEGIITRGCLLKGFQLSWK